MTNTLHIYAQAHEHDEAWIVGSLGALTKLRDCLTTAIEGNQAMSCHTFAKDGEGYALVVMPESEEQLARFIIPYTDALAQPFGAHPVEMISRPDYARLATWPKDPK